MTIVGRFATHADLDKLVQGRLDFIAALGTPAPVEDLDKIRESIRYFYQTRLGQDIHCYLVEEDGNVAAIGFLQAHVVAYHPGCPTQRFGRITNMLCYPEYRLRGFARQTMNALIGLAKEMDFDYITLDASKMGRHLYESLGFVDYVPVDPPMHLKLWEKGNLNSEK